MNATASNQIHILIMHDTQNDAEPLVNHFRTNGYAARSHFIASDDEMTAILEQQTWDLIVAKLETETVNVPHCIQEVARLGKDIPVILLIDAFDIEKSLQGYRLGARDIILDGEPDILLPVAIREFMSLKTRRALRESEIHLRDSEKRVQLLLQNSKDAIAYVHDGMHIYANQSYMDLFGYDDMDDLLCMPIMDVVASGCQENLKTYLKAKGLGNKKQLKCFAIHEDGKEFEVQMDFSSATYDGEPCMQIVISPVIHGGNEELQQQIKDISSKDLLTGFYNRQYFMSALDDSYQQAVHENKNSLVAYLHLLDVNEVRASVGIAGADILLTDVSKLIADELKDSDIVARISDDAFSWISNTGDLDVGKLQAENIGKRIRDHLSEINGKTVQIHCSIGLAHLDESCNNGQEALAQSHQAGEEAIKAKSLWHYFDKSDLSNIADDNKVGRIKHALENDGFRLLFQPVISLRGDAQEHYEVLCRLIGKDGEELSILDYLSAAHTADQAGAVDRWVVSNAIAELANHRKRGGNTKIFINLTPASISDPAFLPWVNSQLKEYRLPGDAIIFQITESDAFNYLKPAKAFSKGLGVLHCKLSINHFGRIEDGFSLTRHLTIEYIKIHAQLVENLETDEGQSTLENMIRQIQSKDIASVVPQIESASVMPALWQAGANYIQGFLLQEPTQGMEFDFNDGDQ